MSVVSTKMLTAGLLAAAALFSAPVAFAEGGIPDPDPGVESGPMPEINTGSGETMISAPEVGASGTGGGMHLDQPIGPVNDTDHIFLKNHYPELRIMLSLENQFVGFLLWQANRAGLGKSHGLDL